MWCRRRWTPQSTYGLLGLNLGLERLKVRNARLLLRRAEGGGADGTEVFARFPNPFSKIVWTGPLVRLGLFQRQEPAVFAPLPRWSAGHGSPRRRGCEIQFPPFRRRSTKVEDLVDYARLAGPEWAGRVAGLCAGTGHLFFIRGGLPAQNFASVAKGKHRKILTGSWQPLVSIETC